MHKFDYISQWETLLTPTIVKQLISIHEFKGTGIAAEEKYHGLVEVALIQSTICSNQLENIKTSPKRENKVVQIGIPETNAECDMVAYRDLLLFIQKEYSYIQFNGSFLLELHQKLYKFSQNSSYGSFKNQQNSAVESLVSAYHEGLQQVPILLLIPMFLVDFLSLSPFEEGNHRISRLLLHFLLLKSNFTVGCYISLEKYILNQEENYKKALQKSQDGWNDNQNSPLPFVTFFLDMLLHCYEDFSQESALVHSRSKQERVAETIKQWEGRITKADILQKCPDISDTTVQRALNSLVKEKIIIKVTGGRYSAYVWTKEREENQ